jgi:hypothetical protein
MVSSAALTAAPETIKAHRRGDFAKQCSNECDPRHTETFPLQKVLGSQLALGRT